MFQPSPNPKVGCYLVMSAMAAPTCWFQPSPNPKVGCYVVNEAASADRGFNPHPTRRLGATPATSAILRRVSVSTLTQPEGWVLPLSLSSSQLSSVFQPSPNPKVGCY